MIETSLLEQLSGFAAYGTLSETARQLHTSQPALTRSMKKLEAQLGVTLFHRTKNRLELNETGQLAARYASRILQENQDFVNQVRAFDRHLHTISIGYCAPVPQAVLTPLMNTVFDEMTISADMKEDGDFPERLLDDTYQLAVTHFPLPQETFYCKKCGHEDLFLALSSSNPLSAYPEIHLKDIDGISILLLTTIGFWSSVPRQKMPSSHLLLQIEQESFSELAHHSDYPCFASDYYIRRGQSVPGKINVPIADPECHTDYYLSCLKENTGKYTALFRQITEKTIY